jgi:hypothetical protein
MRARSAAPPPERRALRRGGGAGGAGHRRVELLATPTRTSRLRPSPAKPGASVGVKAVRDDERRLRPTASRATPTASSGAADQRPRAPPGLLLASPLGALLLAAPPSSWSEAAGVEILVLLRPGSFAAVDRREGRRADPEPGQHAAGDRQALPALRLSPAIGSGGGGSTDRWKLRRDPPPARSRRRPVRRLGLRQARLEVVARGR